jgi:heme A synthase
MLQVALGIATVLLQLTPVVRATHAAVGYSIWAVLVWVSVEAGCWRAGLATSARPGATRKAARAA